MRCELRAQLQQVVHIHPEYKGQEQEGYSVSRSEKTSQLDVRERTAANLMSRIRYRSIISSTSSSNKRSESNSN
jgi:hypothetical protein